MKKISKIILGIITLLPLLSLIAALYSIFGFLKDSLGMEVVIKGKELSPYDFFHFLLPFIVSIIITSLLSLILMIYYIIHAVNNNAIKQEERIAWILIFIFINIPSFPVYWYLRIWNEKAETEGA